MRARRPALLLATALVAPLLVATSAGAAGELLEPRPSAQPRATDDACPDGRIHDDGFRDVPTSDPHEASVDCAVHWQVAHGRSVTSYAPGERVDRAQMASFIARLVERSGGTLPTPTRDWYGDDGGSSHQDAINRLAEAGIVAGKRPGVYAPTEGVTRAQMAAFLTRAYDFRARQAGRDPLPEGGDHFRDDEDSPLEREIDKAAAAGFAGGYGDGTYRPGLVVQRGQMATFLVRALDALVENGMGAVPAGPRTLTTTGYRPYASVGSLVLHAPGDVVEIIGYHEAGHDGAQAQTAAPGAPRSLVLPSRNRGTDPRSAADIVVDPSQEVRSPVTGTVARAGSYVLYCKHTDDYLVVRPDARPDLEVKLLHFEGLSVAAGDRVQAGVTVVGRYGRVLPFRSQVDDHTGAPHWPHVHVEVVDPSIPDRPSGPGC